MKFRTALFLTGSLLCLTLLGFLTGFPPWKEPTSPEPDTTPGEQEARSRQPVEPNGTLSPGTRSMVNLLEGMAQTKAQTDPFGIFNFAEQRESSRGFSMRALRQKLQQSKRLLILGQSEESIQKLQELLEELKTEGIPERANLYQSVEQALAISFLRLAEQTNCLLHHGSDSCLYPIQGSGVHVEKAPGLRAFELYHKLAESSPQSLEWHWLLDLSRQITGGRVEDLPENLRLPPTVLEEQYPLPSFVDIAPHVGLDSTALSGGCVIEDFDRDGDLDVMASSWGLTPENQLRVFLNEQEQGFRENTFKSGLLGLTGGLNLLSGDYDQDGLVDVLVLRGAWRGNEGRIPNSLLRNRGNGVFEDVTRQAGLFDLQPTQTGAWADVDLDGDLDLFLGIESDSRHQGASQLWLNLGNGTFEEVATRVGIKAQAFVKGAVWGDINNDQWPDLFVSTMKKEPNQLYLHQGINPEGLPVFQEAAAEWGVELPLQGFGAWFWDYDNDGWQDLFVASYDLKALSGSSLGLFLPAILGLPSQVEPSAFYRNQSGKAFEEPDAGGALRQPFLAMGLNFGDFDNDGFLDAYLGTGAPSLEMLLPNRALWNQEGKQFLDITGASRLGHLQKGHGVCFGDLDEDGDQDIFAVMGGAYPGDVYQNALFENPGSDNAWVTLRLKGVRSNKDAIGARIRLVAEEANGKLREIYRTVSTGGSFGSSSLQQEIGLGKAQYIHRLEIHWPSPGSIQVFKDLKSRLIYEIEEGAERPVAVKPQSWSWPQGRTQHEKHSSGGDRKAEES